MHVKSISVSSSWSLSTAKILLLGQPNYRCSVATSMETRSHITSQTPPVAVSSPVFTSLVFIDLKKAFDTVHHSILLEKLSLYGIRGIELEWFRSHLNGRQQCCKVNGHISKIESIRYGALQGSCLGPLLFLMYINDLPLSLDNAKVTMYADDTSISYSFK